MICSKCNIEKPDDAFYKDRKQCKECIAKACRAYRENNLEKVKNKINAWHKDNPERIKEINAAWRKNNPDRARENSKRWQEDNREQHLAYRRFVRVQKRLIIAQQTPIWASVEEIKNIYNNCPINMTVDHVVPLKGKDVCGLHVEYNLQYLSLSHNSRKGNRWNEVDILYQNTREIFCN